MSTNPTTGSTSNEQGGIVNTALSYVGLSPSQSRDATTGTASDATHEPAFGAAVGPNSSTTGTRSVWDNAQGASETGVNPRGTSGIDAGRNVSDGYAPAPTLNPHDEERAKVVAARATGVAGGGQSGGFATDSGVDSFSGTRDGRVQDSYSGSGSGIGSGVGSGLGAGALGSSNTTAGPHGSNLANKADPRVDSDRDGHSVPGAGLASSTSHSSTDRTSGSLTGGSNAGLNTSSDYTSGQDRTGALPSRDNETRRGSDDPDQKFNRAAAGQSEGATAGEAQASAREHAENTKQTETKKGTGKLENKSAIPVAGGIQLGEKHWGESSIVPDNPRPEGQADQTTEANTAANAGSPNRSGSSSSGQKEGFVDKIKDKLNI